VNHHLYGADGGKQKFPNDSSRKTESSKLRKAISVSLLTAVLSWRHKIL